MDEMLAPRRLSWSALTLGALALLAAVLAAPLAFGKGGKEPSKPAEWSEEDGHVVLRVFSPRELKAYLQPPGTVPEGGKKGELIVILHGHGGTATGMLGYMSPVAEPRGAYVLACE